MLLLTALFACCTPEDVTLVAPENPWTDRDQVWTVSLDSLVASEHERELSFAATAGEHLTVGVQSGELYAIPEAGWTGTDYIEVTADPTRCGEGDTLRFDLGVGALHGPCETVIAYQEQGGPDAVSVAGSFSDWEPLAMEAVGGGRWEVALPLGPGAYPYKIVEHHGASESWTCNPGEAQLQCDPGYDQSAWDHCTPGGGGCNSLLVVRDCALPVLSMDEVDVMREADAVELAVSWQAGSAGDAIGAVRLTLDGQPLSAPDGWTGEAPLRISLTDLSVGRHTVRLEASDAGGRQAEPLYLPFWTDGRRWDEGLLYYAFVDRFEDGDTARDASEGTTHPTTDYQGGDLRGVIDRLDDLDALGVTALWLTAPLDNPSGAWGSKCGATFSGYHGYWPVSDVALEEHFGDEAVLAELIDEAHARGMRVLVDWVGNHVHSEHPLWSEHPDWFNPQQICDNDGNWDRIPQTCWFDSFLPDLDYTQPEVLEHRLDAAVAQAKRWDVDGFRVDAVKHMPHPVYRNLQHRIAEQIEHRPAGGDEDFYTVGETFDGDRGLIASFIGDDRLDAQFDFPLYFTLRSAFADDSSSLRDLEAARLASEAAYGGATMSVFLGNHDVERFVTVAELGAWGMCADGALLSPAVSPSSEVPYRRLMLAWTWLLAHDGLPLIYYGDEVGLPGHNDPDNRQLMRFDGELSGWEAMVHEHVARLGQARQEYPWLASGDTRTWWEEDGVWGWVRSSAEGEALVIVNRTSEGRTLENGLSWAGLPAGGTWEDLLTDEALHADGDRLSVWVPAMSARVLVPR